MTTENKWTLATGRTVEDVIYTTAGELREETIAHSFILNPEDHQIAALFKYEEWEEILAYIQERRKIVHDISTPEALDRIPDNVHSPVRSFPFNSQVLTL